MIRKLEDFHYYVGETMMFCQCIENDIKFIYAGMFNGNLNKNYEAIKNWTLGKTIKKLQELDYSDGDPYFYEEDYNFFKEITNIRNYWAHKSYISFVYDNNFLHKKSFTNEAYKLEKDHDRLSKAHKDVERVRLDCLKDYNRL